LKEHPADRSLLFTIKKGESDTYMNIVVLSLIAIAFLTLKKGRPYAA